MLRPFDVRLQGNEIAVREALLRIREGLAPLKLDIEEVGTVELVLAEALNNIVEHAYADGDGSKPIRIICHHRENGIHFRIEDKGVMMPDGRLPLGNAQEVTVNTMDLPEGGFGWFMIQDLAKDVTYQRVGKANRLDLRLAIASVCLG